MISNSVLLVEDDIDDQIIFLEALKQADASLKCIIKNNGLEALKYLNACTVLPTFLFLDLNMPVMNGKEFLTELHKLSRLSKIHVIIYSTHMSELIMKETADLGAQYYLKKPESFESLCNSLKLILNR